MLKESQVSRGLGGGRWKVEGKRERERNREGGYLYLGGTRSARAIS